MRQTCLECSSYYNEISSVRMMIPRHAILRSHDKLEPGNSFPARSVFRFALKLLRDVKGAMAPPSHQGSPKTLTAPVISFAGHSSTPILLMLCLSPHTSPSAISPSAGRGRSFARKSQRFWATLHFKFQRPRRKGQKEQNDRYFTFSQL